MRMRGSGVSVLLLLLLAIGCSREESPLSPGPTGPLSSSQRAALTEAIEAYAAQPAPTARAKFLVELNQVLELGLSRSDLAQLTAADPVMVTAFSRGDVNGDGQLDVSDIVRMVNFILGRLTPTTQEQQAGDLNGDGVINIQDVVGLVNAILGRALIVLAVVPAEGSTGIPRNSRVILTFSKSLNSATLTPSTLFLRDAANSVVTGTANLGADGRTVSFDPTGDLAANAAYTMVATREIRDPTGEPLFSEFVSRFTTSGTLDLANPFVVSVDPANGATDVLTTSSITVTFSEAIDPTTVTSGSLKVRTTASDGGTPTFISGSVNLSTDSRTVSFLPATNLASGTSYTIEATSAITDLAGNPLTSFTSTFTTKAVAPPVGEVRAVALGGTGGPFSLETQSRTEEYIVVPYSLALGAGTFTYSTAAGTAGMMAFLGAQSEGQPIRMSDPALEFEARLREWEREAVLRGLRPVRPPTLRPLQEPNEGDTLTFRVINTLTASSCDTVRAILRLKAPRTLLVVDIRTTSDELSVDQARQLGLTFDGQSYPRVRDVFGAESDVNGDGRVTVLITPTVNALTPRGSRGFVGGFFFSADLFSGGCSNQREIFYSLAPDPNARFSDARPTDFTIVVINGVLPHEYQHMINFNQKAILRNVDEDTWLNEGLSHMAEDIAGFPEQNLGGRTQTFIDNPNQFGLLAPDGANLGERGASYLFLRRITDLQGTSTLGRMVQTFRTSREAVAEATQIVFEESFRDWLAALFLSNRGLNTDPKYNFTSFNLQTTFGPLRIESVTLSNPSFSGSLRGHSGQFLKFSGATQERHTLNLSAASGSNPNLLVIRIK